MTRSRGNKKVRGLGLEQKKLEVFVGKCKVEKPQTRLRMKLSVWATNALSVLVAVAATVALAGCSQNMKEKGDPMKATTSSETLTAHAAAEPLMVSRDNPRYYTSDLATRRTGGSCT